MSDPVTTPVVVNPSPAGDQLKSAIRVVLLLLSGLGLLARFLTPEQMAFVKSDAFVPIAAAVVTGAVTLWSQLEARLKKRTLVTVAHAAPDTVAVVSKTS